MNLTMKTNLIVKQSAELANDIDKHRFCHVLVLSKKFKKGKKKRKTNGTRKKTLKSY